MSKYSITKSKLLFMLVKLCSKYLLYIFLSLLINMSDPQITINPELNEHNIVMLWGLLCWSGDTYISYSPWRQHQCVQLKGGSEETGWPQSHSKTGFTLIHILKGRKRRITRQKHSFAWIKTFKIMTFVVYF